MFKVYLVLVVGVEIIEPLRLSFHLVSPGLSRYAAAELCCDNCAEWSCITDHHNYLFMLTILIITTYSMPI